MSFTNVWRCLLDVGQCSCCGLATDIPDMGHSLALVVPAVLWLGAAVSEVSLVPYLIRFYLEGDQRMNCLEVYQLPTASPKFCPDKKLRGIPSCSGRKERIFCFN